MSFLCVALASEYISLSLGTSIFIIALFLPTQPTPLLPAPALSAVWRTLLRRALMKKILLSTQKFLPGPPLWPTGLVCSPKSSWPGEWKNGVRIVSRHQVLVDPDQRSSAPHREPRPTPDRYPSRRYRGQDRNAFHQNILYMVVCEYEHPVVRVPFPLITLVSRDLHFGSFVDLRRERWAP